MDRMETAPASVLEPCSDLLNGPSLSKEQRALALFVRGRAFHRTGRIDAAQHDYDEALRLTPRNEEIYLSRANIAFRQREYDFGESLVRTALAINPGNPKVLRAVGWLYYVDTDSSEEAIEWFSKALDADPAEPFALLLRSKTYARRQQYELALKDADALVAIKPEIINRAGYLDRNAHVLDFHVVALTNRAEIHEAIGKADLAERDLDAAVAHKWAAHSLLERGEFLQRRKGRLENALSDLDAATVLDPENPRAHNLRGLVLMRLGRHELALRSFDRAIDLDPYDGYGWRMRALMHRELDQTEEAVRDYEIAMMVDPRIIGGIIPALQHAGYWMSHDAPQELTPEFRDAIRACMLDKTCS